MNKNSSKNSISGFIKEIAELTKHIDNSYRQMLKQWDLTMNAFLALESLLEHPGGIEPACLADELGLQRQLITWIINDFQARGLILKKENRRDHRRKSISLSKRGKLFAQEVHDYIIDVDCNTLSYFTKDERRQMLDFHRRYLEKLPDLNES